VPVFLVCGTYVGQICTFQQPASIRETASGAASRVLRDGTVNPLSRAGWDAATRASCSWARPRRASPDTEADRRRHLIHRLVAQGKRHRIPRSDFSGLLKCSCCGSNYLIAGAKHYACASYVNGKACLNSVRVRRDAVEEALLAGIRDELLSAESVREACRRVRLRLRQKATSAVPIERIRKAEAEVANLTEALATGALRASHALAARFEAAERQLSELRACESRASTPAPSALLPDIANRYRRLARDLARSLQRTDVDRARIELGRLLGPVRVSPEIRKSGSITNKAAWKRPCCELSGRIRQQVFVVAGAGFEPATFGL